MITESRCILEGSGSLFASSIGFLLGLRISAEDRRFEFLDACIGPRGFCSII